eukprot:CAMPEP_0182582862 /NCGR_PEP_ID=MMETSP1324-20130603/53739_1 /TAXON_ID=236786 /ORGANISM="Florenciella sp., Strain RCC1587" /LENGTH=36 /DNA_ID= /DNA_START= /DNA_END= /DNA_ORIENTATION=
MIWLVFLVSPFLHVRTAKTIIFRPPLQYAREVKALL